METDDCIFVDEVTELGFVTRSILPQYVPWIREFEEPKISHSIIFDRVIVKSGILEEMRQLSYDSTENIIRDLKQCKVWDLIIPSTLYGKLGFDDGDYESSESSELMELCEDILVNYRLEYRRAVREWNKVRNVLDKK